MVNLSPHKLRELCARLLFRKFRFRNRTVARLATWLKGNERSFGLRGLDRTIVEHLGGQRNGFFVELGANNGVSQSNSLLLELYFGWRGVLIEPVTGAWRQLRKNRNARRNHLANVACVSFAFPHDHVEIATSNLMSTPLGVDSDIADPLRHAIRGLKFVQGQESVTIERAIATTLTRVLDAAGAPATIDFLSLDVEGAELEVLKGVDFSRYHFKVMVIESRDIERLSSFLHIHRYRLTRPLSQHDFLFESVA